MGNCSALRTSSHAVAAVKEKLRAEQAEEELKDCTFHPKIKPLRVCYSCSTRDLSESHLTWSSLSNVGSTAVGSKRIETTGRDTDHLGTGACTRKRAWSCDPKQHVNRWEALYFEGQRQIEKQEETVKQIKALQDEAELRECTFAPNVRPHLHTSPTRKAAEPPGFISSISRMRKAAEKREQMLRMQETRDPSVAARGSHVNRRTTKPEPFSFEEGRYKVQLAAEVFTMTVEVGKGKKGKMSVREGEDPRIVARSFCRAYSLQAEEAEWLTGVLVEAMTQRNLIEFVPDETGFALSPVARRKESFNKSSAAPSDEVAWDSPLQPHNRYSPSKSPSSRVVRLLQQDKQPQQQHEGRDPIRQQNGVRSDDYSSGSASSSSPSSSTALSRLVSAVPPGTTPVKCFSSRSPLRVADFAEADSHSRGLADRCIKSATSCSFGASSPRGRGMPVENGKAPNSFERGHADVFFSDAEDIEKPHYHRQPKRAQSSSRGGKVETDYLTEERVATRKSAVNVGSGRSNMPRKEDAGTPSARRRVGGKNSLYERGGSSPAALALHVQSDSVPGTAAAHATDEVPPAAAATGSTHLGSVTAAVRPAFPPFQTAAVSASGGDKGRQLEQQQPQQRARMPRQSHSIVTPNMSTHLHPDSEGMCTAIREVPPGDSFEASARDLPSCIQLCSHPQKQQQQQSQQRRSQHHQRSQQQPQSQPQQPHVWEAPSSYIYERSCTTESSTLPNTLRVTNIGSLELSQPIVPSERSHLLFAADSTSRVEAAAATPVGLSRPSEEENEHSPAPTTLYTSVDRNTDAQSFASVSLSSDEAENGATSAVTKRSSRAA